MSGKARFFIAILAFILSISCGLLTSTATPATQENDAGEAEDSPEAAAQRNFEAFAPIPNRDVRIQELTRHGVYATVRITAEFRDDVDAPWMEKEATVDCQKVGGQWRCDDTFDFQLTAAARGTMVTGQITAALTGTVEAQVGRTQQAEFDANCQSAEVQAGEVAAVHVFEIDFWPEYDRPAMLVIYRMLLSSYVSLPSELAIGIPSAAGEPNAVAIWDANGALVNAEYSRTVQGDWAQIALTMTSPYVQVEYYDPGLAAAGNARHFEYQLNPDFAVDNLFITVQQPANARNMRLAPEMFGPGLMSDGRYYYCTHLASSASQNIFQLITIDYETGDSP